MGRPRKYKDEYAQQAYKLCLLGLTDAELAKYFEVDELTINRWKVAHSEFCKSLKEGKENADARVAEKLYHRAIGYSHQEDKVFLYKGQPVVVPVTKHYPPETAAAIFWLKNRQKGRWRDKTDHKIDAKESNDPIRITFVSPDGLEEDV